MTNEVEKSFDLIARLIQADERERCAKICDEYADRFSCSSDSPNNKMGAMVARTIAWAIRGERTV